MKQLWKRFLAYMHRSDSAVCEMSDDKVDYHDYCDDEFGMPVHMTNLLCKRCGKTFTI